MILTQQDFERALAFHCAPALAGIKPANLISCSSERFCDLDHLIEEYAAAMGPDDIRFDVLCRCENRALLLVYRGAVLHRQLAQPDVRRFLERAGYPFDASTADLLGHLRQRLRGSEDFPHEIGLFLGYPLVDVCGFQRHRGKNYKLCGHWKVYGDAEAAKRCFDQYDRCRHSLFQKVCRGMSITQLFSAA